ncbi:MAG: peptidylprolyl isomerase [Pseudomonadota bacterium]
MRILSILGAMLLGALLIFVGASGARWLGNSDERGEQAAVVEPPQSVTFDANIDAEALKQLLLVVDLPRRQQILNSPELFAQFVAQEKANQSVISAAYANNAHENEALKVLMDRAAQRILAQVYLNRVVQSNFDPNFPSDEQVRAAYEGNKDSFRTPDRVHLSQIFLFLDENAQDDKFKATWKLADQLSADLKAGKTNFAAAAKKHSEHEASRRSDGYMGLIALDQLLPAIAEAVRKGKENTIAGPIASDTGLHIIKIGALVGGQTLELDNIYQEVRAKLQQEVGNQIRQAAIEKIQDEYPVSGPTEEVETLRENLLLDQGVTGQAPTQAASE